MSSTYKGQAGNVSFGATTGVNAVTVANPATIQSTAAHGLTSGDYVHVKGETTAAILGINGLWPVTVIDSTHFSIPVNAGATSLTGAGTIQPLTVNAVTIPSDGDAATASSVNTPLDGLADRTTYGLALMTGAVKVVAFTNATHDAGTSLATPWIDTTVTAGGTWQAAGSPAIWTIPDVLPGDIVQVELTGSLGSSSGVVGSHVYAAKLYSSSHAPGGSAAYAQVIGSAQAVYGTAGIAFAVPITLKGIAAASVAGSLDIQLYFLGSNTGDDIQMVGDYQFIASVFRVTSVPQ